MKFSEIVRLGVQGRFCGRMLPPTIAFLPRSRRIPVANCRKPVALNTIRGLHSMLEAGAPVTALRTMPLKEATHGGRNYCNCNCNCN